MVVAALQPWAEISERLRRIVYKFETEASMKRRSKSRTFLADFDNDATAASVHVVR